MYLRSCHSNYLISKENHRLDSDVRSRVGPRPKPFDQSAMVEPLDGRHRLKTARPVEMVRTLPLSVWPHDDLRGGWLMKVTSTMVSVAAADGQMPSLLARPEGDAKYPGVIVVMEAF